MNQSLDLFEEIIGNPDQMATTISSFWDQWKDAKIQREQIVDEVNQYKYATSTETTENDSNGHNHTTHRPKLMQLYDNLKANYVQGLMPNDHWFEFEGEDEKSVTSKVREGIEAYLRTKHRMSKFDIKVTELVDDWIDGDCFAQVVYVNEQHQMPDDELVQGYVGPRIQRIAPKDIVFNPFAIDWEHTPKIIRSVKTIGEAARDIEERPDLNYQRDVWDKIMKIRSHARGMKTEDIRKTEQASLDGFGSFAQYIIGEFVEFLDFYGDIYDLDNQVLYKNRCVTVVDRRYVIRNESVDTWNGQPLIFHASYRQRKNNLWGMGALENLLGMQYYINHLENAKADAFDDMLIPDRVITGDVDEEITGDKGEVTYYIANGGDVKNLAPDPTVLNADFKIEETERKMDEYAGAPREAVGFRTPGEKTKFEVQRLENASQRFFQHNMNEFEKNFLVDIINAEVYLSRRYLASRKETIRVADKETGAKLFKQIGKEDLTANGKLIPKGASHYARKQQLTQNLMTLESQVLNVDKELLQHFPSVRLARLWEEIMEFEEYQLVQPYGRIPEQLEMARRQQTAQDTLTQENAVNLNDSPEVQDVGTAA